MMGPHGTEIAWPAKLQDKTSRAHNHHISLRERLKEYQSRTQEKHPKSEGGAHVTTKAAAWAVFQHHGGGGVGVSQAHGSAVRCPTRFKIEAQMKHEVAHPSVCETVAASWDAGSTLFDSFELDSLLKTLDEAANSAGAAAQEEDGEGAIVVYSQKHWIARPNSSQRSNLGNSSASASRGAVDDRCLDTVDETGPLKTTVDRAREGYKLAGNLTLDDLYNRGKEDADSDPFANFGHTPSPFNVRRNARRSFDSSLQDNSGRGGSRDSNGRSRWKGLLHTLHLDSSSGLFNRFQGFHAQVAPHDSQRKMESKASRGRAKAELAAEPDQTDHGGYSPKRSIVSTSSVADPRFDPNNLHISKDVHPPAVKDEQQQRSSWKQGLKAMLSRPFSRQGSSLSEKSMYLKQSPVKSSNLRGQKVDLHSEWSSLKSRFQKDGQDQKTPTPQRRGARSVLGTVSLSHHEQQHHYHHHAPPSPDSAADFELSFQAISRRISRSSFEERARRFSIEEGGINAPRNSLATPRSSGDPAHDRNRPRLTPWEAESSLAKGSAYIH